MNLISIFAVSIVFLLSACSDPLDSKIVADKGVEAYRTSLAEFFEKGDPEAIKAFDYFAKNLTIEQLGTNSEIDTPRKLIVKGSELILEMDTPEEVKVIEGLSKNHQLIKNGLYAIDTNFQIKNEFFGLTPYVTANYINESGLSFSESTWVAELFLDDNPIPVASYTFVTKYETGFDSGYSIQATRMIGHVSGDPAWITPSIQRAKNKNVKIRPLLGTQKGLDSSVLTLSEEMLSDYSTRSEKARRWLELYK